jgi:hypothetical protein
LISGANGRANQGTLAAISKKAQTTNAIIDGNTVQFLDVVFMPVNLSFRANPTKVTYIITDKLI